MRFLWMAFVLLLTASPAIAQDALSGTWNSSLGGLTLKFDSMTGTYTMSLPNQTEYEGDYTISGQSVTFDNEFGSQVCPGLQGIYNYNGVVNSMEFVVIEDQCTSRRDHLRGTWTNAGML